MIKNAAFVTDTRKDLFCSVCKGEISTCDMCGKKLNLEDQIICHTLQIHLCSKACKTRRDKRDSLVGAVAVILLILTLGLFVVYLFVRG